MSQECTVLNDVHIVWFSLLCLQATVGPCTKDKPEMFDMVGRAKWEAWSQLGDMAHVILRCLMLLCSTSVSIADVHET